jgi:hypothetical protein
MTAPAELLAKINAHLDAGRTVCFTTNLRSIRITKKLVARFRAAGYEPIVAKDDGLYIRNGKSLEFAGGCRIEVFA